MRHVRTLIATDAPAEFEWTYGSYVTLDRVDVGARVPKLQMYTATPAEWQYVLYLDADTEILEPAHFFYEALELGGFDMVLCRNPGKYHTTREMARNDNRVEVEAIWREMGGSDLLQWNGGVMAFRRSPEVEHFFALWQEAWQVGGGRDQPALHRAMWKQPLRVLTLGSEFNCSTRYSDGHERKVVLHYQTEARELKVKLPSGVRADSEQAWGILEKQQRRWKSVLY